jgi:hypothetical protein
MNKEVSDPDQTALKTISGFNERVLDSQPYLRRARLRTNVETTGPGRSTELHYFNLSNFITNLFVNNFVLSRLAPFVCLFL